MDIELKSHAVRDLFIEQLNPKLGWIHFGTLEQQNRVIMEQRFQTLGGKLGGKSQGRMLNQRLIILIISIVISISANASITVIAKVKGTREFGVT